MGKRLEKMGEEPETGGGGGRERKDTASARRNVRFVGRGVVADKLLWREALRKAASTGSPRSQNSAPRSP